MGQDPQADLPVLAVIRTRAECRAEVALEHTDDGLRLPPLTVKDFREVRLHQFAVVTADRMGLTIGAGTAAVGGRNDTANLQFLPTEPVEAFCFVARIAQQGPQRLVWNRLPDRSLRFYDIQLGPPINDIPQDQMVGRIPDRREFYPQIITQSANYHRPRMDSNTHLKRWNSFFLFHPIAEFIYFSMNS